MIANLNEINRVLLGVRDLTQRMRRVRRDLLTKHLDSVVIRGGNPEFDPIIDFVQILQLIDERGTGICLTDAGREVLSHNQPSFFELQPAQAGFLFRKCYLDGEHRNLVRRVVKKFDFDEKRNCRAWSEADSPPINEPEWVCSHLEQLGVIAREASGYLVTAQFSAVVDQFVGEGGEYTEEQMEEYFKEKKLVGNIAEKYAIDFERKRLADAGFRTESLSARCIAKTRINAGYDIESFDGRAAALVYDRFIEVKGSGQKNVRFIWSQNEISLAKKLREKYWIYFIGGIERKKRRVTREPILIQNPLLILEGKTAYTTSGYGLLVEGVNQGEQFPAPVVMKLK